MIYTILQSRVCIDLPEQRLHERIQFCNPLFVLTYLNKDYMNVYKFAVPCLYWTTLTKIIWTYTIFQSPVCIELAEQRLHERIQFWNPVFVLTYLDNFYRNAYNFEIPCLYWPTLTMITRTYTILKSPVCIDLPCLYRPTLTTIARAYTILKSPVCIDLP
jgi:hypothetical protein